MTGASDRPCGGGGAIRADAVDPAHRSSLALMPGHKNRPNYEANAEGVELLIGRAMAELSRSEAQRQCYAAARIPRIQRALLLRS